MTIATGEPTSIVENGSFTLASFAYDDRGRRTTLTRGNGTSTSYGYDAVSRLSQLADNLSGTANDQTLGFGYNPASQIVSNTRSNDSYAWQDQSLRECREPAPRRAGKRTCSTIPSAGWCS